MKCISLQKVHDCNFIESCRILISLMCGVNRWTRAIGESVQSRFNLIGQLLKGKKARHLPAFGLLGSCTGVVLSSLERPLSKK